MSINSFLDPLPFPLPLPPTPQPKSMAFTVSPFKPSTIFPPSSCTTRIRPVRTVCTIQSRTSNNNVPQPSIADIERAIGIASSDQGNKSKANMNMSILDMMESTPIGKEGPAEKALREAAEKFTDHAEVHTASVHRFVLELFVKILPLWLLVVAIASGLIKLPFSVPFIDDLIM